MRLACLGLCLAAALAAAVPAVADPPLVAETADWHLEAPAALGTQADLELSGREIQLCTDEIVRLTHHRPGSPERFTWHWEIGGGPGSWALPTGVETRFPDASYRLVDPAARAFRESVLARGTCFGPHEITHVLTWESWHMLWANEGFATLTDWLYQSGSWRYGEPVQTATYDCDESGWTDGVRRHPYSDLRRFTVDYDMYATAGCFWLEIERRGGFPALRRILMRLRAGTAATVGELVVHHVDPVLGLDFRPIAERYGFTDADLVAEGPPPPDPPAPSLVLSQAAAGAARAGRVFTASVAVTRSDTGDPPASAAVACSARLPRAALRASAARVAAGRATCSWRLPRTARGQTLRTTIVVSELGVEASARSAVRVRP